MTRRTGTSLAWVIAWINFIITLSQVKKPNFEKIHFDEEMQILRSIIVMVMDMTVIMMIMYMLNLSFLMYTI